MKTANEYSKMLVELRDDDFQAIDELTRGIAANFSYKNTMYSSLEVKKALFMNAMNIPDEKGKYPPKTRIESMWDSTPEGMQMLTLHRERESLKVIIKAIESKAWMMREEIRLSK